MKKKRWSLFTDQKIILIFIARKTDQMKNYPVTSLNYYNFFAEKAIFIDYSNLSFSLTLNKKFSNLTSFIFPFLARGWSSGYRRLDRNQKPRMKSLWHPGQSIWKCQGLFSTLSAVRIWFLIYVHYLWKKKKTCDTSPVFAAVIERAATKHSLFVWNLSHKLWRMPAGVLPSIRMKLYF